MWQRYGWSYDWNHRQSLKQHGLIHVSDLHSGGRLCATLEERARTRTAEELRAGVRAYSLTLVSVSGWKCERRLHGGHSGPELLLEILVAIYGLLLPTERFLWRIFGTHDADFDGAYTMQEVLVGVDDIVAAAGGTDHDVEGAIEKSVVNMFERSRVEKSQCAQLTVLLSDLLAWWWSMSDEFRDKLRLTVTTRSLQSIFACPAAQMFPVQLTRLRDKNDSQVALEKALLGHAELLAELQVRKLWTSLDHLRSDRLDARCDDGSSSTEWCSPGACSEAEAAEVAARVVRGGLGVRRGGGNCLTGGLATP